jgi:predicted nucleic acid-binding protein
LTYLVDTNVLIRVGFRNQAMHPVARAAVLKLRQNGERLLSTSQSCVEFWNVATRPQANNGLGVTIAEANQVLRYKVISDLRKIGFDYQARKHLIVCKGRKDFKLNYRYLGADDTAGPNYTGQAAVNSHYEQLEV